MCYRCLTVARIASICENPRRCGYKTVVADTMCALDFYELQSRLDGAICTFSEQDKFDRLKKLTEAGVRNIEMESSTFLSMYHYVGLREACVCVTLLNRLEGDQISSTKEQLDSLEERPQDFVLDFIKAQLSKG